MNNNLIKRMRDLSSSLISDALEQIQDEKAVIRNIKPRTDISKMAGPAFTVKMKSSNKKEEFGIFEILEGVERGQILFIDVEGRVDVSTFGGLAALICLRKGVAGTVINGACRDAEELYEHRYPVYSKGLTPKTGRARIGLDEVDVDLDIEGVKIKPNDLIFADKTGIVRVPKDSAEDTLNIAESIKEKESEVEEKAIVELSVNELSRRYKEI